MDDAKFEALLQSYREIWNNRLLDAPGKTSNDILDEAMRRELLDENSHPRTRKSPHVKFYFAIKRVMASSIPQDTKLELIQFYIQTLAKIEDQD